MEESLLVVGGPLSGPTSGLLSSDKGDLSSTGLTLSLLKTVINIGILGISFSIHESGWFFLIFIFLISIITYYNAKNIAYFVELFSDRKVTLMNYFDIGEYLCGKKMKNFIKIIWGIEIFFIGLVFFSLSVNFLKHLINLHTIYIHIIVSSVVFLITLSKSYSKTLWLTIIGNLSILSLFSCLLYQLITLPVNSTIHHKFIVWKNLPKSMGIVLCSFGGHIIFPELFDSIKRPVAGRYGIAPVTISWIIITIFSIAFGIIGYYLYGDNIQENLILNLAVSETAKKVLISFLLLSIILTFPFILNPLFIKINDKYYYIIRIITIIMFSIICYFWTSFIDILTIVGGFLENITTIILPPVFMLKTDLSIYEKIWNICIIIFGITIFFTSFTDFIS